MRRSSLVALTRRARPRRRGTTTPLQGTAPRRAAGCPKGAVRRRRRRSLRSVRAPAPLWGPPRERRGRQRAGASRSTSSWCFSCSSARAPRRSRASATACWGRSRRCGPRACASPARLRWLWRCSTRLRNLRHSLSAPLCVRRRRPSCCPAARPLVRSLRVALGRPRCARASQERHLLCVIDRWRARYGA